MALSSSRSRPPSSSLLQIEEPQCMVHPRGFKMPFHHWEARLLSHLIQSYFLPFQRHSSVKELSLRRNAPCIATLLLPHTKHFYGSVVKNPTANAGDAGGAGSIPGSGRSPGEENDNPLQYSCPRNLMDRRAWQAIVLGVAKNWTRLNMHTHS